jgi:hypothetical protein
VAVAGTTTPAINSVPGPSFSFSAISFSTISSSSGAQRFSMTVRQAQRCPAQQPAGILHFRGCRHTNVTKTYRLASANTNPRHVLSCCCHPWSKREDEGSLPAHTHLAQLLARDRVRLKYRTTLLLISGQALRKLVQSLAATARLAPCSSQQDVQCRFGPLPVNRPDQLSLAHHVCSPPKGLQSHTVSPQHTAAQAASSSRASDHL